MFWRHIDKNHPKYEESLAARYGGAIENIYIQADQILDKAMKKLDQNTILMVMSDHGFSSFRYSFNMNTWLKENGFLSLVNEHKQGEDIFFMNTDWSGTKAYALGLNSLYINQKGREREGIVNTGVEKNALVRNIASKLENFKDSRTGNHPVLRAFITEDVYSGKYKSEAPDIILGFNRDYRISWATPLGRIPKSIIEDNKENWSGDHCVAPEIVPGILFVNRKIKASHPALEDLTATILNIFGIPIPSHMTGKSIL
jgi:predicted AlkP superfamily phosphohydrolase/phosphomutase